MPALADEKVLFLDCGSQYAQLLARRVRRQHVYCEIVRHDISAQRVREFAPKGLIDPQEKRRRIGHAFIIISKPLATIQWE